MQPLILILCTGNSCRSHMAEGILRAAVGDKIRVASAGSMRQRAMGICFALAPGNGPVPAAQGDKWQI